VSAAKVVDGICTFLGGPYDPDTRTYHTPALAGVGQVRRAWPREDGGYFDGLPPGSLNGCVIVVQITEARDSRVALPAIQGRRLVRYAVDLHYFVESVSPMVEDCADFVYRLYDDTINLIRVNGPTLGSGGIEANAFQIGEGQPGEISARMEQGGNVDGLTKAYMQISFEAHTYDVG
jgi:hypothetical protein